MVKLKTGFSPSDLWVHRHDKGNDFKLSSWQKGECGTPLLIVRLILALCSVVVMSMSLGYYASNFWLIYLTNWGVVLLTMTLLSALLVSLMGRRKDFAESQDLPWYVSMYWLLTNVNVSTALLITLLYWVLIFVEDAERSATALAVEILTHGINSFLSLAELFAARTPVNLAHIYQPLGFGIWYAAFSAIYFAAGGVNSNGDPFVYEVLDWRDGANAGIMVAISASGILAVYLVIWFLAKIRDKISDDFIRTTSQDLPLAPPLTPVPSV